MKKFSTSTNGYDKMEVNAFVNEIITEYEKMLNNLKARDAKIKYLQEKLKQYESMENTLHKALLVAEDSSTQIRKLAKEEANMIIADAKKNASRIVNDSLLKAEKVDLETEQLKQRLKLYKSRIKQTIEEQLTMVEDVDKIEY